MDAALNWMAQGAIVALAAAAGLRVMPVSHPSARVGLLWTAYALVLALPAVRPLLASVWAGSTDALAPAAAGPVVTMPEIWWTSPAAWIGLWLVWAALQTGWLAAAVVALRDARRRGRACPAGVLARLPHWSRVGASGRRPRVILSNQVRTAAVLGGGAPIIALAPLLVDRLGPADLDRVLVHEWAHVQRRDDLAQLAQRVLRILVGWHPAAWWLDRQLAFEREAACDAIVVTVTGSARDYAACLTRLAALPRASLRAVPALTAVSRSRLGGRVVRILAAPGAPAARSWRPVGLCAGGGLLACTVAAGQVSFVATAVRSAAAPIAVSVPSARPVAAGGLLAARSAEPVDAGREPTTARRPESRRRPAAGVAKAAPRPGEPAAFDASSRSTTVSEPLRVSAWRLEASRDRPAVVALPATPTGVRTRAAQQARDGWTRAAEAGLHLGRASRRAGTATGRAFSRFGRKVADSF